MTLGERIKKLRKDMDLTQQQFADKIGSTQNVLANYETGRRNPSSSVINNICKTFGVSETWLRTGEGEMLLAKPTAALDALAVEYSLSNSDYTLIEKFLALKPETRKAMTDYMREVVASITAMEREGSLADAPAFPSSPSRSIPRTVEEVHAPTMEEEARAEAEQHTQLIYEQILAEKKAQAGLSSESSGPSASGGTAKQT